MTERDAAGRAEIDQLMKTIPPMDATVAPELLREAKEVFDELGVVFFLRQGTCLSAVRDGAFIPWDDDIDLGSIYGMHGLTKRSVAVDNLPAEQPAWPRRLWRFLAARLAGRTAELQYGKSWSYSRWACNFAHQALARDSGLPMGA